MGMLKSLRINHFISNFINVFLFHYMDFASALPFTLLVNEKLEYWRLRIHHVHFFFFKSKFLRL